MCISEMVLSHFSHSFAPLYGKFFMNSIENPDPLSHLRTKAKNGQVKMKEKKNTKCESNISVRLIILHILHDLTPKGIHFVQQSFWERESQEFNEIKYERTANDVDTDNNSYTLHAFFFIDVMLNSIGTLECKLQTFEPYEKNTTVRSKNISMEDTFKFPLTIKPFSVCVQLHEHRIMIIDYDIQLNQKTWPLENKLFIDVSNSVVICIKRLILDVLM